ncbi:MAG: VanW family protein [Eubacteriales bacterium]|nr:VanW family protein [Eubacteriales bacterium]
MKKRFFAFSMALCMAFTSVPAIAVENSRVVIADEQGVTLPVQANLALKGDTKAYIGKDMTMKATVTGLSGAVTGVTVAWTVNGKRVEVKSGQTIQNGDVLTLTYALPQSTTAKSNIVQVTLTQGSTTLGSASTKVTTLFGFSGATMTLSKSSHVTVGNTRRVKVTLKKLAANLKVSYQWYVDGKKVSSAKGTKTLKKGTNTLTYSYKAKTSGKHTVSLVLTSSDGKVSVTSPVKELTVHKKYAKTLASYTTQFAASNTNRSTNLRIAIKAINGKVVQPGKTFSLNSATGRRTAAKGYKKAIIFVNGKQVYDLAGGVCQVSSTLFNAALLSNMTIVQRHNHSASVTYVPKGRDAAVAYDAGKDFKFKNNLSVPVKIVATYNSSGSITIKIKADYGTSYKKPKLKVTRSNGKWTLRRTVNGKVNYTTTSIH